MEDVALLAGGGHKKAYRKVDFRRDKLGVPAKVAAIEYDPNRTANLALLHYADGEKRYILHPVGLEVGATVSMARARTFFQANALQFKHIPPGTMVHNLELYPGRGGASGAFGGRFGRNAEQRRRSRAGEAAFRRSSQVFHRVHGDSRPRSATSTMRMRLMERLAARGGTGKSRPFAASAMNSRGSSARGRRRQGQGQSSADALGFPDAG